MKRPVGPQSYLDYAEYIEAMRGRTTSLMAHTFLLFAISRAIASAESQEFGIVTSQWTVSQVCRWVDHLLEDGPPLPKADAEALRQATQDLKDFAEMWMRDFQARSDSNLDN